MKWPSFTFEHIIISACCVKNEKEKLNIMFTGATDISGEKCRSNGDIENVRLRLPQRRWCATRQANTHIHTGHTYIYMHTHVHTHMHVRAHTHIYPYTDAHTLNESGYLENVVKSDVWTQIFGEKS